MKLRLHLDKYGLLKLKKGESKVFRFIKSRYSAFKNAAFRAGKRTGGKFTTHVLHEKPKRIVITREA